MSMTGEQTEARTRALLVGVSNYAAKKSLGPYSPLQALPGVEADLTNMHKALSSPEFGICPTDDQITFLRDPEPDELEQSLRDLLQSAGTQDELLIYFAGHGHLHRVQSEESELWLCCRYANTANDSTLFPGEKIWKWVKKSYARAVVIILDCCYASYAGSLAAPNFTATADGGEFRSGGGEAAADDEDASFFSKGVVEKVDDEHDADDEQDKAILLITASYDRVQEQTASGGLFTRAIVKGLEEAKPADDGSLSVEQLRDYIVDLRRRDEEFTKLPKPKFQNIFGDLTSVKLARRSPASRQGESDQGAPLPNPLPNPRLVTRGGALWFVDVDDREQELCPIEELTGLEPLRDSIDLIDEYAANVAPDAASTGAELVGRLITRLSTQLWKTIGAERIAQACTGDVALRFDFAGLTADEAAKLKTLPWEMLLRVGATDAFNHPAGIMLPIVRDVPCTRVSAMRGTASGGPVSVALFSSYDVSSDADNAPLAGDLSVAREIYQRASRELENDDGVTVVTTASNCAWTADVVENANFVADVVVFQGRVVKATFRFKDIAQPATSLGARIRLSKAQIVGLETVASPGADLRGVFDDFTRFAEALADSAGVPVYAVLHTTCSVSGVADFNLAQILANCLAGPNPGADVVTRAYEAQIARLGDMWGPFMRLFTFWPIEQSPEVLPGDVPATSALKPSRSGTPSSIRVGA